MDYNALNPDESIIRKQIESVTFGFYADEDVRHRSVVQITSPVPFDPMGNAMQTGLYDPRLGPYKDYDYNSPCPTCASAKASYCPGHFGHIELFVCIYQPILFMDLLQVLRCKCYNCHNLQGNKRSLRIVKIKLLYVLTDQLELIDTLDSKLLAATRETLLLSTTSDSKAEAARKAGIVMDRMIYDIMQDFSIQQIGAQKIYWTVRHKTLYTHLVKEAMVLCKLSKRCYHCGAVNPKTRQDQYNKIFQAPLSVKSNKINQSLDVPPKFVSALSTVSNTTSNNNNNNNEITEFRDNNNHEVTDGNDSDDTETGYNRNNVLANRRRSGLFEDDSDDDDDDDEEIIMKPETTKTSNKKQQKQRKNNKNKNKNKTSRNQYVDDEAIDDDEDDDDKDEGDDGEENQKTAKQDRFMHTAEVQAQLKLTYRTDPFLCNCLFGSMIKTGTLFDYYSPESYQLFFMSCLAVPPSRFRPPLQMGSAGTVQHSQTQHLSNILRINAMLQDQIVRLKQESRSYQTWIELQTAVNVYMDSSKDPRAVTSVNIPAGIRQILEKKEGLFRKHMMGKRVNYCCRSVISPDPYVGTNEIGIPQHFANTLTYPTAVTDWNISELRRAVIRGCEQYPGARWVEMSTNDGTTKRIELSRMNQQQREALAAQLLTHSKKRGAGGRPAIVGRQLRDGDYVLMNRQPTLHKPGIMAHQVRILHNPTQKTIRMHYANCNTYNADFDGDEMNCHYPQSDIARAEAQFIVNTNLQYIVPTDGSPLRGLIQDHVVGGVQLTKMDTFLERWEYQQLLFSAFTSLQGLELIRSNQDIELLPPAIIKPRKLWTGKQVISTLLLHLRKGNDRDDDKNSNFPGLSTEMKAKTPDYAFGADRLEHLVLIRDGELLRGILDKNAFGATDFSLVHAVYEAYGPDKAGLLLNALGRLFTAYVQFYSGHSCRMEDLILTKESDEVRRRLVHRAYNLGAKAAKAWADSDGGKVPIPSVVEEKDDVEAEPLRPHEAAAAAAKIGVLLSGSEGAVNFANLDGFMQSQLNPLSSTIVKKCLPSGLAVPFPANSFSIMTTTGAKGSIVNQSQVTCALGQQALEGRRVPRMSSGRTLPSFQPYEPHPRADGFVMDRFLTGIRPQEYYFHCMAGREGLVDTAVKTSRSGYLQRCLIKHLEELKISYDYTVRNAEGAVVQFLYGEDGLDPTKSSYLDCSDKSFRFMALNSKSLTRMNAELPSSSVDIAADDAARFDDLKFSNSRKPSNFRQGDYILARRIREGNTWTRGALCIGWYAAVVTKVRSTTLDIRYASDGAEAKRVPIEVNIGNQCGGKLTSAISSSATIVKPAAPDPIISSPWRGHIIGRSGACVSERIAQAVSNSMATDSFRQLITDRHIDRNGFSALIGAKFSSSLCAPGEAVGCIAGQSVGEPSTQMTLNTFHLAGAGANVTLGIPRLREIIMTASRILKTPTMSVPIHSFVTEKQAVRLTRQFQRLPLMELISGTRGINVTERLEKDDSGEWLRAYYVTLNLHPAERIKEAFDLSTGDIATVVSCDLVPYLATLMKEEIKRSSVEGEQTAAEVLGGRSAKIGHSKTRRSADDNDEPVAKTEVDADDDDDENDEDDDLPGEEDGMDAARQRERQEGISYDEEQEEKVDSDNESEVDDSGTEADEDEDIQRTNLNQESSQNIDKTQNSISMEPLRVDPSVRPLLMVGLVEKAAEKVLVRSRKNIQQAFLNDELGRGRCLQIAGINFEEMWKIENVDHNRLMSNDIWAICSSYGVEAGRNSIVEQIGSVFGAYGIEVDPRHLSLIADYMTFEGGYKPMNRIGMEGTGSTLLQMSFETTANFMKKAASLSLTDELESPSANIVVGRPVRHGTGAFTLLAQH